MRDALAQELGTLARQSAECSEAAAKWRARQLRVESGAQSAAVSRELRRLLYTHFFAGAMANLEAQHLIARSYRWAGRKRLEEDEQLLPLVLRACGPVDWARCAAVCRAVRARGIGGPGLASYWFRSHSPEGHKEAFQLVVQCGATELLMPLAEARADVDCVFENCYFRTPLHRAASRGNLEACGLLLLLRADPRRHDSYGAAPLHLVASKGRMPIMELLLHHDPGHTGVVDFGGRTPCHMAALKGHLSAVQRLVQARADAGAQALDGRTALDMAQRGQHTRVIRHLEGLRRQAEGDGEALHAARTVLRTLLQRAADAGGAP